MTTEHTTKTAKATTPLFALLRGLLRAKGTGASFVILLALGVLALTPAIASANSAHGSDGHPIGEPCEEALRAKHECSGAGQLELVAPFREVGSHEIFSGSTSSHYSIAGSGVAVNDEYHDV